jgi:RimJ/RimL family protein N-acetyltransferase
MNLLRAKRTGLVLRVNGYPEHLLRAVRAADPQDWDVEALTSWRNQNATSFLTEFTATVARTRAWLTHAIAHDPTRILFMVDDAVGKPMGHMGLAFIDWERRYAELDSVVRGRAGSPGCMSAAARTLLEWAAHSLGIRAAGVRVLSDNSAVHFYEGLGFVETARVPLRSIATEDGTAWIADRHSPTSERWLLHMERPKWTLESPT